MASNKLPPRFSLSSPNRWSAGSGALLVLSLAAAGVAGACGRTPLFGLPDTASTTGDGGGGFGGGDGGSGTGAGGSTSSSSSSGSSSSSTSSSSSSSSSSGTGGGGPCMLAIECDDNDNCTTDECTSGMCAHGPRDDDKDGFVTTACGGPDCNDLNPNVNPTKAENCTDGADNNCNGVADCVDPACANVPNCGCVPTPGGENCTNGKDDDCDTIVDCFDAECVGTPTCGCLPSENGLCGNGFDDDCDGNIDCDDSNCASDPACICSQNDEVCTGGGDEDCDLLIDCGDPECQGVFPCACVPPGLPEQCGDGQDNDCDKLVDCADPECLVSPLCQMCSTEICNDGVDNNCNNQIDCADPACFFDPGCSPVSELCNNGLDDDNDTKIDCQDTECANNPFCVLQQANCLSPKLIPGSGTYTGDTTGHISETKGACGGDAGEAVFFFTLTDPSKVVLDSIGTSFDSTLYVRTGKCNTGKEIGCDDDSAGSQWAAKLTFNILYPGTYYVFLDGYTIDPDFGPNEGPFVLNVQIIPNPPEICNDGIDNDGDVFVDCADPNCSMTPPCDTCLNGGPGQPEFGIEACVDGLDNDCDGTADCVDNDCSASDFYVTECCDGDDDNDNGIPDDFNCKCASDADCDGGQICYTHTAFACGIPCDFFFGDVCPFVASGSFCNATTHQCEF